MHAGASLGVGAVDTMHRATRSATRPMGLWRGFCDVSRDVFKGDTVFEIAVEMVDVWRESGWLTEMGWHDWAVGCLPFFRFGCDRHVVLTRRCVRACIRGRAALYRVCARGKKVHPGEERATLDGGSAVNGV